MSEKPATESNKMTLKGLLEKVELIAKGADSKGCLPDTEEYDKSTAPNLTMMWCASVLRILISRVREHVIEQRGVLSELRSILQDPALKKGDPWSSDLPALRGQLSEMGELLGEIVKAIKAAEQAATQGQSSPTEASQEHAPAQDPQDEDAPSEASDKHAEQAQLDALAASISRGESPDLASAMEAAVPPPPPPPPPPPNPIHRNSSGQKRPRNPAGNEKA